MIGPLSTSARVCLGVGCVAAQQHGLKARLLIAVGTPQQQRQLRLQAAVKQPPQLIRVGVEHVDNQ